MSLSTIQPSDDPISVLTAEETAELAALTQWSMTWRKESYIPGCICAGSDPVFWGHCGCMDIGTPPTEEEEAKFDRISELLTKDYYAQ